MNLLYMVGSIVLCAAFSGSACYFEAMRSRSSVADEARYGAYVTALVIMAVAFGLIAFGFGVASLASIGERTSFLSRKLCA